MSLLVQRTFSGSTLIPVPLGNVVQLAVGGRHTCAVIANGGVRCWGENTSGQLGNDTTIDQPRPFAVPSFTLNIDPLVHLRGRSRVATVQIIATCEAEQELHVEVTIVQGDVSGHGVATGACTGSVERYPVTVPAHGPNGFVDGPGEVHAQALIRDHGLVADTQQWTRRVQLARGRT
jgi:hypothetical protein